MILNEKYIRDIDDEDDDIRPNDIPIHRNYKYYITYIAEHYNRNFEFERRQFEHIEKFVDMFDSLFDEYSIDIQVLTDKSEFIGSISINDSKEFDIHEYKNLLKKTYERCSVSYHITFPTINCITIKQFAVLITNTLRALAAFHGHHLVYKQLDYTFISDLVICGTSIFSRNDWTEKYGNNLINISSSAWKLENQSNLWHHIDIISRAYMELLDGKRNYKANDIDVICKLWGNKINILPRIIKYIYDVWDTKYSFAIDEVYVGLSFSSVHITPRDKHPFSALQVRYSELYSIIGEGYTSNGRGTLDVTISAPFMTKFDIIYDSFNQMDRMCNRLSDDNVRLHINYNADVTFSGVNTYQLRYILKNLLEKTEITTVYIDNIIDMPSGKSITLKPYEDFKNSDCVEFYKTNNPNMYQIKPFRRNGYITELTITRL